MSFAQNKYTIIKSAISKELAAFVYDYFLNKRLVANTLLGTKFLPQNTQYFGHWSDRQVPGTYSHYSDIAMETLLQKMKPVIEEATNFKCCTDTIVQVTCHSMEFN
jgi:hypothetical protein